MTTTTIQVSSKTRRRLVDHRIHPRQPYDDVINRALDLLDEDDLELSPEFKRKVARSRTSARRGKLYTTGQVLKELGL
jgi:hypothetical protein